VKVLVDQKIYKSRKLFRYKNSKKTYTDNKSRDHPIGFYYTTKSWWQDLERTWTTEVRVWETLYDCALALFWIRGGCLGKY